MKTIAVIGGGASGLMAAAMSADLGARVLLFEKNEIPGRKLSASGNGRGNVTNRRMELSCYHSEDMERLSALFPSFSSGEALSYLRRLGILFHDRNGYIYPRTDRAQDITDALLLHLKEMSGLVNIITPAEASGVCFENNRFRIDYKSAGSPDSSETAYADSVILCCGGLAAPQLGADESGCGIAESFGHHLTRRRPALTYLTVHDSFVKTAAGVRAAAEVKLVLPDGKIESCSDAVGEVQFTKNAVSGIPVFQISRRAGEILDSGRPLCISVDLLPELDRDAFERIVTSKIECGENINITEWLLGLVHPKLTALAAAECGITAENKIRKLSPELRKRVLRSLRDLRFSVSGYGGYRDAQVTAGGVKLSEITDLYESRLQKNLYITGELLDVDGICGGYNLTFAMNSGLIAAKHAAAVSDSDSK